MLTIKYSTTVQDKTKASTLKQSTLSSNSELYNNMKRKYKEIDDGEDVCPPIKQQRIIENYPIKMVILGGDIENNNNIPQIYSSLEKNQQGLTRKCSNQYFDILNMFTTIRGEKNIHLTAHFMKLQSLLHSELIERRYYKPYNTILNGSSVLLYNMDIRDEYIEFVVNTNYNPQRMGINIKFCDNDNVSNVWKYWMLNKLIFSLAICNLSSPKQLFIIFNGLQDEQIKKEILRRKVSFFEENYAENINNTENSVINSEVNKIEIAHFRSKWLNNAKKYIQTLLFKHCGWKKQNVKFVVIPKLSKKNVDQTTLKNFYQDNILSHIQIPQKIYNYYSHNKISKKFKSNNDENVMFRMFIQESFIQSKTRFLVLIGHITHGFIKKGQKCSYYPFKQDFIIQSIQNLNGKTLKYASMGQSIGICTNIKINYDGYAVPRLITNSLNDNFKECGIDFKYCYVSATFHWNRFSETESNIKIGQELLLNVVNQRSTAHIIGIKLDYSTCQILKIMHDSILTYNKKKKVINTHNKSLLFIERLIISFCTRVNDDYYCDDPGIMSIKSSTNKINVCIKPLCDLTGIVIDETSKPFNQFVLLSNSQIVAKGKVLRLLQQ